MLEVDSGSLGSVLNRNNCPSQQLQQMQAIEPAVASNEINGIRRGGWNVFRDMRNGSSLSASVVRAEHYILWM